MGKKIRRSINNEGSNIILDESTHLSNWSVGKCIVVIWKIHQIFIRCVNVFTNQSISIKENSWNFEFRSEEWCWANVVKYFINYFAYIIFDGKFAKRMANFYSSYLLPVDKTFASFLFLPFTIFATLFAYLKWFSMRWITDGAW